MSAIVLWLVSVLAVLSPAAAFELDDDDDAFDEAVDPFADDVDPFVDDVDPLDRDANADADAAALEILSAPAFAFCHDEDYPLLPEEEAWCPLVGDPASNCPALPKACAGEAGYLEGPRGRYSTRRTTDAKKPPTERGAGSGPNRRREQEREQTEIPSLGGVGQLLFWGVIIVAILALLAAILSNLGKGRGGPEDLDEAPPDAADPEAAARAAANRRAMETDVDRLLAMAKQAANAGDYPAAVDYGHAALLRRLDHEHLIQLHRSRTNGDYVRQLRGQTKFFGPVREALRAVDRAQFGTEPADRSAFESIFAKVSDIVRKAGPLVLLLGLFGLSCDELGDKNYAWKYSPSGSEGVVQLLRRNGGTVEYRRTSLEGVETFPEYGDFDDDEPLSETPDVIVMLRDAEATEVEWTALYKWVSNRGGTLVIAGASTPPWLPEASTPADFEDSDASPVLIDVDPDTGSPLREWYFPSAGWISVPRSGYVDGVPKAAMTRDDRTYAGVVTRGAGRVVVLPDDYLFTNASLAVPGNGAFLHEWLVSPGGFSRIEFIDGWAQAGADDPLDAVGNSHLTPALLQLLLLIVVLYLWRGRSFGLAKDPRPPTRRAFVQHAKAMGQLYHRAGATRHAAGSYAGWVLDRLRDQYPIAASGGLSGLAGVLAHRAGRDETEVVRLLIEAHDVASPATNMQMAGPTDGEAARDDLLLVRELGRLLRQAGGHK